MFIRIESDVDGVAVQFADGEIDFPSDLVRVTVGGALVFEQPRSRLRSWMLRTVPELPVGQKAPVGQRPS